MLKDIQKQHTDKKVEVWFQDEARVGQQGRLTRIWSKRGDRPRMQKDMRFEYAYIYGAICPTRDTGEAIVVGVVNKEAMEKHLAVISESLPQDRHAVIVLDKAPWHKNLKVPQNITTLCLPSYSPELNPHENVWEYLKNNFISNTVFRDTEHVIDTCCTAWMSLCSEAGRIRSIGSREWANID